MKNAIVLLSGGLDSTTVLAIAQSQGFDVYALSFDYGQRHKCELESARNIASVFNVKSHLVIKIDLRLIGGSALTSDIPVPKGRDIETMKQEIPVTYVPARNTIFLSFALAWAEVVDAHDIFISVNALDYSGYPDCRPEYIQAYEAMANLATKNGIEGRRTTIHSPLINMSKVQIIQTGLNLGIDYSLTHSCYSPTSDGSACGVCDSCILRNNAFDELKRKSEQ